MTDLWDIDLAPLIADHGCRYLADSGVDGIEAALTHDFEQIYAIEGNHKRALDLALRLAANHGVTVIHARLEKGLREALDEMRQDFPAIFRLDGAAIEPALRLVIARRDTARDVFLIGDAAAAIVLAELLSGTHSIENGVARPRAGTGARC